MSEPRLTHHREELPVFTGKPGSRYLGGRLPLPVRLARCYFLTSDMGEAIEITYMGSQAALLSIPKNPANLSICTEGRDGSFWDTQFYEQMRRRAAWLLRTKSARDACQPEDLIHEAYLRLTARMEGVEVADGGHYFAIATRAMRRSMIDKSRAARALKRSGDMTRVELESAAAVSVDWARESLFVTDLIDKCASKNARLSAVARMHFLEERTAQDIAGILGISSRTVKRDLKALVVQLRKRL